MTGRTLAVGPARFYLSMVLLPAVPQFSTPHLLPSVPPPSPLPSPPLPPMDSLELIAKHGGGGGGGEGGSGEVGGDAALGSADSDGGGEGGFLCCGALRHYVLAGVEATLAPSVTLELMHGTLRAAYLQPARCAAASSGVVEAGGADSADCGVANTADCQASPTPKPTPCTASHCLPAD